MFLSDRKTASWLSPSTPRGLEVWWAAERLVYDRWQLFLDAEPRLRGFAYWSYLAALDAEEAAAAEMARSATRQGV